MEIAIIVFVTLTAGVAIYYGITSDWFEVEKETGEKGDGVDTNTTSDKLDTKFGVDDVDALTDEEKEEILFNKTFYDDETFEAVLDSIPYNATVKDNEKGVTKSEYVTTIDKVNGETVKIRHYGEPERSNDFLTFNTRVDKTRSKKSNMYDEEYVKLEYKSTEMVNTTQIDSIRTTMVGECKFYLPFKVVYLQKMDYPVKTDSFCMADTVQTRKL